jgi:LPS O-antigen subunit length determinant protein (WzzB/FepE family)
MAHDPDEDDPRDNSLTLGQLALVVLKGWYFVIICVAIGLAIAINYLQSATYIYSAQMQITPPQNSDSSSSNRLGGALGGLASLAGVSLPTGQSGSQFQLFVESLTSRDLTDALAQNDTIMKTIFADQWDEATQTWHEPAHDDWYLWKQKARPYLGLRPLPPWHKPDGGSLQVVLGKNLQVQQDALKPYMVKVVFYNPSPKFGVDFLNAMSAKADDLLREKALLRSKEYIAYLSNQLKTVTIAEHREAISQALSEQEKFAMVASSGAPFAADIFERPWASTLPTEPNATRVLSLAIFLGGAVGGFIAYAAHKVRWSGAKRSRRSIALKGPAAETAAE